MSDTFHIELSKQQTQSLQNYVNLILLTELKHIHQRQNTTARYLNKKQTCSYIGISNNTLDKWIEKGLPVILVGKMPRFDRFEVEKFMLKHQKNL